ncbi:hypothetical protein SAMN05216360_10959 [Methylobacterium phyllostachyos]|uniref:Uncharacterized protein n=1 Tax=Methylobacterium phyllostachyos TaxID=582672 RepID=A0A1H0C816_9HYPH|nr:hypothetical protein [Methylobacterium phyllostachyos]SDN54040.1 hypothetical protein SAMN05216360_10959 [Methylobacterium phyllostachyos]
MGSSDPELRMRRLAELRAAYDACPGIPGDRRESCTARHSRVLLGRILVALNPAQGCTSVTAMRPDGKSRADA